MASRGCGCRRQSHQPSLARPPDTDQVHVMGLTFPSQALLWHFKQWVNSRPGRSFKQELVVPQEEHFQQNSRQSLCWVPHRWTGFRTNSSQF
jgi:hypothetical protein